MSRDITPISFKTVPGRNKTQKWTKAPAVDYGGDEWGGYDDYGEYEDDTQPPLPPSIPTSQVPRDPYASSGSGPARKNSFDQGDETRAFSSNPHPAKNSHQEDSQRQHTPGRSPGRDFTNPEQVPAPLSMHNSPVPAQGERWPGRKESMSSRGTPPMPSAASGSASASGTSEKALPFIRPSDIYKRIPDEIRRQSEDGARPSMDSIRSGGARERTGLGLEPVAESRESRVFLDDIDTQSTALRGKSTSPRLPDVTRFSGFGDEFLTGSSVGNQASPTTPHSPEAVIARVANAPVMSSTGPNATSPNSIQHSPITRAPAGQDPAAEILTERQHGTSVESIAGGRPAGLQHQPSAGFRSAVHTAFDRNDNVISRDNSQGSGEVHRSDTTSTAGISPIISRGPQFPSIAEETSSSSKQGLRGQSPDNRASRKPSPGRAGGAGFEPGYRRSLDPPSSGTSPARTPGLESVETRRLSTPMSAVPMDAETPDVIDQGAEMPVANLEPVATPLSEVGQLPHIDTSSSTTAPIPITGRGRSGTDYSMREADIAQTINSASPEQDDQVPGLIDAQRDSQKIFLQTHPDKQPASPISPGGGLRGSANGSRAGSPTKGRVREIADKFHGLNEAARRNSAISVGSSSKALSTKSSWSNFDDTEKKLGRQGTGQGESEMFPAYDNAGLSPVRPGVAREESFKPDLPGGWISSAPTPTPDDGPGAGRTSPMTPQQNKAALADEDELTPTTRKVRLQEALTHKPSPKLGADSNSPSAIDQVKNAGSELGAALMASVGVSHQTRDFASTEPPAPVDEREAERPARGMQPPTLFRQDTDSDAPSSVASTMPPSPPAKDTPKLGETLGNGYFNTVAPLRVKSREESPAQDRGLSAPRPGMTTALSMEPGAEDEESDRLRKEIVRSLDPIPHVEDAQLTQDAQDALDAPDNQRRVANGQNAMPPAESRQPPSLQTRFSWEKPTPLSEQAEPSPEIKPEMSYERPRSRALHVVNPNEVDSPVAQTPVTGAISAEILKPTTFGTPVTEKQESAMLPDTDVQPASPSQSLKEIPASPTSERKSDRDVNRQSYYASDSSQAGMGSTTVVPGQGGLSTSPISSAKAPGPGKPIPPFRNILALKTGDERIKSYNETRTTFANMNTGLGDWVGGMLALHPELASNATTSTGAWKAPPLQTAGSGIGANFLKGHKASPSIAKFTNKFGGSESQLRSTSVGSVGEDGTHNASSPSAGGGVNIIRPTTSNTAGPSSSATGLPAFDTDKMQQKGKAFMAKTGVLGGKAQAGAKGLFAKGKSRFASGGNVRSPSGGGSEKV